MRQLDNDVQEIHVLLRDISAAATRHGNRPDRIDGRRDGLVGSMAEVLRRLPGR